MFLKNAVMFLVNLCQFVILFITISLTLFCADLLNNIEITLELVYCSPLIFSLHMHLFPTEILQEVLFQVL